MQVDEDQSKVARVAEEPLAIQEKVAEIKILVEESCTVEDRGDPGHLVDDPPLDVREGARLHPGSERGDGLVKRLAAGQLGNHEEARQLTPWTDLLARGNDLGHLDPEGAGPFQVSPFLGGG